MNQTAADTRPGYIQRLALAYLRISQPIAEDPDMTILRSHTHWRTATDRERKQAIRLVSKAKA